ncbi:MAG: hypothetical protein M9894_03660 [Planctomycetes bacterium]|nr:hypothetical protein [Planctomycetota bacterium]
MRLVRALLVTTVVLAGATAARAQDDLDFKKLIERGEYAKLAEKLRPYLNLERADPKLRRYLEMNLEFLARGARTGQPGHELILFRGAKNDQVYRMPAASGGDGLMLPNSIRHMRTSWDKRLPRIDAYFREATTLMGGNGDSMRELDRIIEHHKGGGLGTSSNSVKSVLISTSTRPLQTFGPPWYILKVAPERAIFNHKGLSGEYEVLLPFWVLPKEIVARCETWAEVEKHPLYQQSKLKGLSPGSSWSYSGAGQNTWAIIEDNIRNGRPPLEGVAGMNSYFRGEGLEVGPNASERDVAKFLERIARHGAAVEWVNPGDPRLPEGVQARTYVGPDGRPKVLLRRGQPVKSFALIDELAAVIQLERMIKARGAAETEALLMRAHMGDPAARDVVNRWEIRAKRLIRSMLEASDPARPALDRSIAELERELDPHRHARRADGTIDWKRLTRAAGGSLVHFTMALFLKELAVVAQTGDRLRIEEFFDGLLETDFYVHFGLFSVGAMAGDAAYAHFLKRHLDRFIRPQFVHTVMRSTLALAVGMALPDLVSGHFQGRAFAIQLTGLGLSSTAVKAGVAGLRWVKPLERLPGGAALATRLGRHARLMKVGGFMYHAVETAVVLYWGEAIATAIDDALVKREARAAVRQATDDVLRATREGGDVRAALERLAEANRQWRDVLARPLAEVEHTLWERLGRAGVNVKREDDALRRYRELAEQDPGRYGALAAAAERHAARAEANARSDVARAFEAFDAAWPTASRNVYGTSVNDGLRLDLSDADLWALRGGAPGATGDPWGGRTDVLARWGRDRALARVADRAADLPTTRLGSYDHEAAFLEALATAYAHDPEARDELRRRAAEVRTLRDADRGMVLGEGPAATASRPEEPAASQPDPTVTGFIRALEEAGAGDGR